MRHAEILAVAYFVYLVVATAMIPLSLARRLTVWLAAAVAFSIGLVIARVPPDPAVERFRDWWPVVVILLAYYVTAAFYLAPSPRVEAWLGRWDDRLVDRARLERLPRLLRAYFEIVYDACFLMIPGGFAILAAAGHRAMADRYWTLVGAAELLAFCTLPWMPARPPRAIDAPTPADRTAVRRVSLVLVNHVTIGANTFPSGHASGSLAVALALWPVLPWAGAVFMFLAISIAVGSVVGRFHYSIDAITGLLLALALWALMPLIPFPPLQ